MDAIPQAEDTLRIAYAAEHLGWALEALRTVTTVSVTPFQLKLIEKSIELLGQEVPA